MLLIMIRIKTPSMVPQTRPRPPVMAVPPMTTAAIASSSARWPTPELETEFIRINDIKAAIPAQAPTST